MAHALSPEVLRALEFVEIDALLATFRLAPSEFLTSTGAQMTRVSQARVLITRQIDAIYFNRVVGLGIAEPATEAMVDDILGLYKQAGVHKFAVQLSPAALPANLPDWLLARGFHRAENWAKCQRGPEPPPDILTNLHIVEIGQEQGAVFSQIACSAFQFPAQLSSLMQSAIGHPAWRFYLAMDGKMPVGVGALFLQNGVGWLGMGATLPSHRRRGAQGAMMARRIRDAAALGCHLLVTETGEDMPASPNPSYHNMLRTGFKLAYLRPAYIWG
jgi:hypothetical protein